MFVNRHNVYDPLAVAVHKNIISCHCGQTLYGIGLGLSLLCQHNFEHNRKKSIEHNVSIIDKICIKSTLLCNRIVRFGRICGTGFVKICILTKVAKATKTNSKCLYTHVDELLVVCWTVEELERLLILMIL